MIGDRSYDLLFQMPVKKAEKSMKAASQKNEVFHGRPLEKEMSGSYRKLLESARFGKKDTK
jgi:hypothetical protein